MRRSLIKKILVENKIRPSKKLGQSFLVPETCANRIFEASGLKQSDGVVEIGPGLGILTEKIAGLTERVLAVEIDPKLYLILEERLKGYNNVELQNRDFLELNLRGISQKWDKKLKILGNLPYSITKPLLAKILECYKFVDSCTFTVQEEVARRICASSNAGSSFPKRAGKPAPTQRHKKEYGILSLLVQYRAIPEYLFRVPPDYFYPSPKVWSAVIRLNIRPSPAIQVKDEKLLFRLIYSAFSQRRKMLRNTVKNSFNLENKKMSELESASGIEMSRRGETLTLEEFGRLSDCLIQFKM
jgi:16S rRNA (adenine1518-N6/adenine1519-N6)-dimethyltransferase